MGETSIETLLATLGVNASKMSAEQVLQLGHQVAQRLNQHPNHAEAIDEVDHDAIVLRPTARAAKLIGITPSPQAPPRPHQWYLNIIWVDGRKNGLLMHAATTFPIFVPDIRAAHLRPLGIWLSTVADNALASENLAPTTLGDFANSHIVVAKPDDRRILGYLNQTSLYAQHRIEREGGLASTDIADLNHHLRRDLHNHGGTYTTAIELITGRRH